MKLRKAASIILSAGILFAFCGCGGNAPSAAEGVPAAPEKEETQHEEVETVAGSGSEEISSDDSEGAKEEEMTMNVVIGSKTYTVNLDSGKAASELKEMLPLTLTMNELNGNEKYGNLPEPLTQDTYSPKQIHTGDILLWGSDTLVIFYQDFPTQYSYTRIGSIAEPDGLEEAVGRGNVEVTFQ